MATALEDERLRVNSVHYQGVDRLAPPLIAEATAPDGVIEAASARVGDAHLLGVQWHPEWCTDGDPAARAVFALFGRMLRGDYAGWSDR